MASTPNPYSNLSFASYVDWKDVQPALLQKLNAAAKTRGQIIDIISGYRSPKYNEKVGGAQNSLHTQGRAVDAYIDGKPIGEVWDSSVFTKLGLRSGNQPNFFHGKPDPEHVDMGFTSDTKQQQQPEPPVTSYGDQSAPDQPTLSQQIAQDTPDGSIGPVVGPNVVTPRDVTAPADFTQNNLPPRFETWQLLAQLPGASPDTMNLARMASMDNGNG